MKRALFISDLHVNTPDDERAQLLSRLLAHALSNKPDALFLVGDIFDLWIADRPYFVARFATLIEQIRKLVAAGVQVHYFEGNHDLDLEIFWRRELGVHVHTHAEYFDIGGRQVRVEHGDQMDPTDRGYLFLRWFLRTPVLRLLGRVLPNGIVRRIGERASRASREYTSHVKTSSYDRALATIRTHAQQACRERPFDVFVSGHVHEREDSVQTCDGHSFRCLNLGTWLKEPLVLVLDDARADLIRVDEYLR